MSTVEKGKKAPLFKLERAESGIGKYAHVLALGGFLVLAVAVYIAGIMLTMPFLAGLALFIGLFAIVGYLVVKRKFGIASEIDVDAELEKYRNDLIDTFNGYEVDYSAADIDAAVAEYREVLERETASMSDVNMTTMSQVISDNFKKHKQDKAAAKAERPKKASRRSKKNRSAVDEDGNIIKLRDLD